MCRISNRHRPSSGLFVRLSIEDVVGGQDGGQSQSHMQFEFETMYQTMCQTIHVQQPTSGWKVKHAL